MNMVPPETIVIPPTRNGLRLTGNKTNKLKADPDHERTNELATTCHQKGWQSDCTQMVDFLC